MGYFVVDNNSPRPRRWLQIGVGVGDLELAKGVIEKGELVVCEAPEAEAVYVCGWCLRVVLRSELNHADGEVHVCDECVMEKLSND